MIRHIVWWTLKKQDTDLAPLNDDWHFVDYSRMLHGSPYLSTIEVSEKMEPSTTVPCQFLITTTHKNIEDLEAFRNSDIYKQFMLIIDKAADKVNVIDYADDQDPALENMGKPVY